MEGLPGAGDCLFGLAIRQTCLGKELVIEREQKVKVDFFCIGAAKSRTTWLYRCLVEHPGITLSKSKEPNFFVRKISAFRSGENPQFMRDWEWYAALFEDRHSGDMLGEFSIHLIHNTTDAPYLIRKHFPEAKFIVMLRDPVARIYSHYWHEKRFDQIPGLPDTFEEGLENQDLLFRSRYYDQLKIWLDVFPAEKFYIILDIDLEKDSLAVLHSLFNFLGVNQNFRPAAWNQIINPATERHHLFYTLSEIIKWARNHRLGMVFDILNWIGINNLLWRVLARTTAYPPLEADTERWLRNYFLPDIEKLEKLIDRDLAPWKEKRS